MQIPHLHSPLRAKESGSSTGDDDDEGDRGEEGEEDGGGGERGWMSARRPTQCADSGKETTHIPTERRTQRRTPTDDGGSRRLTSVE